MVGVSLFRDRGHGHTSRSDIRFPTYVYTEDRQMDHHPFDHLTRLFGTAGSRRTAWRALLAGALLRATTRPAAAGPCDTGKNPQCTCGTDTKCPPGKCFVLEGDVCPLCCAGNNIICGATCCLNKGDDPCDSCALPENPNPQCQSGITGSYRRR